MPLSSEPAGRWAGWLGALWGDAAAIGAQVGGNLRPVLTGRGEGERVLHLPAHAPERLTVAAAAHAAAHWRFGGPPQPRTGLKPVQQALFAALEDARVEALALQELPGLRALWLPFHRGEDAPAGNGFDALLARLARSLLERDPADAHPWIAKARAGFFARDGSLALSTPEEVRAAASRLGNDIGQMRLPFNASTHCVHAAYRDDGSWLWQPEPAAPDSETTLAARAQREDAGGRHALPQPQHGRAPVCYPEWDARIARYRRDWCQVHVREDEPPALPPGEAVRWDTPARHLARRFANLRGPLPRLAGRSALGDELDAIAAVEARVQQRAGGTPDERVYRARAWPPEPLAVQLLVDASASTADPAADGEPWLEHLLRAALACSLALDRSGHRSAVLCFRSRTRERVEVRPLKRWEEAALAPRVLARCAAERGRGSTRTGAALRHATHAAAEFGRRHGRRPVVLVLTDGDVHDVDVPDPDYLRGDLGRAIAEAQAGGVSVRCLQVGGQRRPAGWPQALVHAPRAVLPGLLSLLGG